MSQLTYTVPVLGSTGWGVALNDILTEIKTAFNDLEGTTYAASYALISDANGKIAVSSVTSTELGYLSGVSSSIQNQLNAKADTAMFQTVSALPASPDANTYYYVTG